MSGGATSMAGSFAGPPAYGPAPVTTVVQPVVAPAAMAPVKPVAAQSLPVAPIPIPTTYTTAIPTTTVAPVAMPLVPPAPVGKLTEGFPDPQCLSKQKDDYAKSIDDQLKENEKSLEAQVKQQKELLHQNAEKQKAQYLLAVDQQVKQQELLMSQKYNEQLLWLQQDAQQKRVSLQRQVSTLEMEYRHRKTQEDYMQQSYQIQKDNYDAQVKLMTELKELQESAVPQVAAAQVQGPAATRPASYAPPGAPATARIPLPASYTPSVPPPGPRALSFVAAPLTTARAIATPGASCRATPPTCDGLVAVSMCPVALPSRSVSAPKTGLKCDSARGYPNTRGYPGVHLGPGPQRQRSTGAASGIHTHGVLPSARRSFGQATGHVTPCTTNSDLRRGPAGVAQQEALAAKVAVATEPFVPQPVGTGARPAIAAAAGPWPPGMPHATAGGPVTVGAASNNGIRQPSFPVLLPPPQNNP